MYTGVEMRKETKMAKPLFQALTYDTACGKWVLSLQTDGWFLLEKKTGNEYFMSEDEQEALDLANQFIKE
jgi:hypothetical protein